jgi:response regulator RpfG family c-di-GMP phosphodiesterase
LLHAVARRADAGRTVVTGSTVLVIDDDEDVRHALGLLFELDGFSVVGEAANGVDGLALARRHQPDFVVLDPVMPRLGGDGTAAILRAVAPSSKIVAFGPALRTRPAWADSFLNEDRVGEVAPLLTAVIPRRNPLAYW